MILSTLNQHSFLIWSFLHQGVVSLSLSRRDSFLNSTTGITQLSTASFGFSTASSFGLAGAVILILTGLFLASCGFRFYRLMIALVGFYVGACISVAILNTLQADGTIQLTSANRDMVYLITLLISGIATGAMLLCTFKLGVIVVGLAFGFFLGTALLQIAAIQSIGLNYTNGRIIFLAIMSVLGGILVYFLEAPILILSTSFIGSFAACVGLDYFVQSNFGTWLYRAVSYQSFDPLSNNGYYMIAGFFVLAMASTFFQYHTGRKRGKI